MASKRDMSAPNWKRTRKRLERNAAELRQYDAEVRLPDNWETPPKERVAQSGPARL